MTLQILAIVLYSRDGERRDLQFKLNGLNIITGASKTGKTAIIDIIDYCLGRSSFTVPDGVIRDHVSWYGLHLQGSNEQIFVARPAPEAGRQSTNSVYLTRGRSLEPPPFSDLSPNGTTDGLESTLSDLLDLEDTGGQLASWLPAYDVTVRHATFFMFQRQDEIISRDYLFHRQGEDYGNQTVREVLPFFLGAVTREDLALSRRAAMLRRTLRRLQSQLREREQLSDGGGSVAQSLLAEAAAAGLRPSEESLPSDQETIRSELREILAFGVASVSPGSNRSGELSARPAEVRERLLNERSELRTSFREVQERLRAVRLLSIDRRNYSEERAEQVARLRTLNLVGSVDDGQATCPLCESNLSETIPSVQRLLESLQTLERQVGQVPDTSRSTALVARLEQRAAELRDLLADNAAALTAVDRTDERMGRLRDEREQRLATLSRIDLYLQSVSDDNQLTAIRDELARVRFELGELEDRFDSDVIRSRIDSMLSIIARDMQRMTDGLELEYSGSPIRFDLQRLTVVADTPSGAIPMSRMGSGENWVTYHLIAHLALHRWFAEDNRPVPNVLVFDQPSQIYFPSDPEVQDESPADDNDRSAVLRLFKLIYDATIGADIQVILTDHADLREDWFQESIAERWRNGRALIPAEWLNE